MRTFLCLAFVALPASLWLCEARPAATSEALLSAFNFVDGFLHDIVESLVYKAPEKIQEYGFDPVKNIMQLLAKLGDAANIGSPPRRPPPGKGDAPHGNHQNHQ